MMLNWQTVTQIQCLLARPWWAIMVETNLAEEQKWSSSGEGTPQLSNLIISPCCEWKAGGHLFLAQEMQGEKWAGRGRRRKAILGRPLPFKGDPL